MQTPDAEIDAVMQLSGELQLIFRGRETLARSQVLQRTWPLVLDLCVAASGWRAFTASS